MRIDCHNHVMPKAALDLVKREPVFGIDVVDGVLVSDKHPDIPVLASYRDPEAKLAELDANELDGAVVSMNPPLLVHTAPADAAEELSRVSNQGMSDFCAVAPDRLRWMAHVPLQDPERAVAVLEEAAGAGCAGVEICTLVDGRRLDAEEFEPFWSRAAELRLAVFTHPGERNPEYPGFEGYFLRNVIGNLLETTLTAERLICAGVLDRHPRLRLLLPHGGGYFPYQAGRLAHAETVRPELSAARRSPWDYRGQLVTDTITHDDAALGYLLDRMGTENVVLGTDLPTPMSSPRMWTRLRDVAGPERAAAVAERNPAAMFGFA